MRKHETEIVRYGDCEAEIDKKIAPLILKLWKLGLDTCNSCEANRPGIVWIQFATMNIGKSFVNLIATLGDEEIYDRATGQWDVEDRWEYAVFPTDYNRDIVSDTEHPGFIKEVVLGPPEINFTMSVRFPFSDLKRIEKILDEVLSCTNTKPLIG